MMMIIIIKKLPSYFLQVLKVTIRDGAKGLGNRNFTKSYERLCKEGGKSNVSES